ncbi:Peroxisome chaperone and import receptor [Malassezia vespertilionis]|uniref:Pex19p n=1 Tax=Malassezia vespertilionis TaxID=2020962 RepID=A0A2N1J9G4_9BASI|nr:Peroxisome chaperone and import receptor [Malassezia vespertilionis]PKI83188.1 Pex19p [Malassezia vespertilionis]WFD07723.1 Peroxisome chaperone and import receptor [Malassezia vespertilionis]
MAPPTASVVDDLDDLDDVLDDFNQKPASLPEPAEDAAQHATEDPLSDDFVQELTNNMESFMAQLGKKEAGKDFPSVPPPGANATGAEDEMMKQFERMLSSAATQDTTPDSAPSAIESSDASQPDFQDAVKATMEKLRESNDNASKPSSGAGNPLAGLGLDGDADIAKLLQTLGGAGGEGGDMSDLTSMLSSMMEDLMNKDVLYEPLKEMHARFPDYFASEKGKALAEEDRKRFKQQEELMGRILAAFDAPGYSDANPERKHQVSELVSQLQDRGAPPEELLGDMPPELSGLSSMLGDNAMEENCVVM